MRGSLFDGRIADSHPQMLYGGSNILPAVGRAPGAEDLAMPLVPPAIDGHRYAYMNGSSTWTAAAANIPELVLRQQQSLRNFLALRNMSPVANIWVDFGKQASTDSWLLIAPGFSYVFDTVVFQDDIWAISDTVGGKLAFGYSTIAVNR